ncbi:MAG TPA: hypothetical protein VFQ25_04085 [Ktedonobacterales bacterium]|nr:hypothetical protein [Ktedonobacterales bacterium]
MSDGGTVDDNRLHAAVFPCPGCGEPLFRVDLSPMADEYHFYCDQCANRVDVSYYDTVTLAIDHILADRGDTEPGWERGQAKRRMIEERL